jgi:hypothetical protein
MATPKDIGDLAPAVELILQPLVLETLVAVADCKTVQEVFPADTDPALLTAAVRRLTSIGAIQPCPDGPFGRHYLTSRGRELLLLLENLDVGAGPKQADS